MNLYKAGSCFRNACNKTIGIRCISINAILNYDKYWREKRNMPRYENECGPLTDLPDWSYIDGRPAPLGSNQKRRYIKSIELTKKVVDLLQQVDMAVDRSQKIKQQQVYEKQTYLENKLKPKGGILKQIKEL